jgi:hypothetical protein
VVVFWGGELVSSPLLLCSPHWLGMPCRAFARPLDGIASMKSTFCFSLLFVVLVVRMLDSPSELLALAGGLPSPQSSRRGQR